MRRTTNHVLVLVAVAVAVAVAACADSSRITTPSKPTLFEATATATAPAGIPAPPTEFTLFWSDDFTGAVNTGVDTTVWKYDTGPGRNFGTGEIENMTNSTANVFKDGAGTLVIRAIKTHTTWTSGRIETKRADFGALTGGVVLMQAAIRQPDSNLSPTNGTGYWPAFWMRSSGRAAPVCSRFLPASRCIA